MKQTSLPLESTPDTSLSSKADSKKIKAGSSVQVNSTDRQDVNLPKKEAPFGFITNSCFKQFGAIVGCKPMVN